MASGLVVQVSLAKDTIVDLFELLVTASASNGDSSVIADLASTIIPKILSSEDSEKLEALKERAKKYVEENSQFLSDALRKGVEEIFFACIDRLSDLARRVRSVTSSANLDMIKDMQIQFHPRKDSGAENESGAEEELHWLEVDVIVRS